MNSLTKIIAFSAFLMLTTLPLFSQIIDVRCEGPDQPAFVSFFRGGDDNDLKIEKLMIPDWAENPVAEIKGENCIYQIDLSFLQEDNLPPGAYNRSILPEQFDPGPPVEGDLPSDGKWSQDGSVFAFVYRHSENVIFYDATTYATLAVVPVPGQPVALEMAAGHAYVCCHASQEIYVISLQDYQVTSIINVYGTPCQVEVNADESVAYVACDSHLDGKVIAFDLAPNLIDSVIFETRDPLIYHLCWMSDLGRVMYIFTKFTLSPDGNIFVAGMTNPLGKPAVFNAYTGAVEEIFEFAKWRGAGFSGSGDTLYLYSNREDTLFVWRINTSDYSIIDSVRVTAACNDGITTYTDMAISSDGSKVAVTDTENERICLFDFNTGSCQFVEEMLLFTGTPISFTNDDEYVIYNTWFKVKFIDFASGQVLASEPPGTSASIPLIFSPNENKLVVSNLPFYSLGNGNETLFALDFNDMANIIVDTALICGQPPEGDVPVNAVLRDDGEKILSANYLTENLSIINFDDHNVDTLVSFPGIWGVKVIPGSGYALVNGTKVWMMSTASYEVLDELNIDKIKDVFISPDGRKAYLIFYMTSSNIAIYKINIDGSTIEMEDQAIVGGCLCSIYFSGDEVKLYTTPALSPNGQMLLIGSDDPTLGSVVNIVSTETMELLASVPAPEYCIYGFSFTDDSRRAIALSRTSQVPVIYLDGENSYLENLITINDYSYSADYNPLDGLFYVLDVFYYIYKVDPVTGEIMETMNINTESNRRIAIDKRGIPLVLTQTSMVYDREIYPMPGGSVELYYDFDNDLFVSTLSGPDRICIFNPLSTGIQQFRPGRESRVSVFPNPAADKILITSPEMILQVRINTLSGSIVFSGDFSNKELEIAAGQFSPGVYLVNITTESGNYTRKMVVQ
jgi:DNA-binding beta-propeller fold protein YncE